MENSDALQLQQSSLNILEPRDDFLMRLRVLSRCALKNLTSPIGYKREPKMTFSSAVFPFIVLVCTHAFGDAPKWISLEELANKAIDTEDATYFATSFYRCAALYMVVGGSIQRDFGQSESPIAEVYNSSGNNLFAKAIFVDAAIRVKRGAEKLSQEEQVSQGMKTLDPMMKNYVLWMNENQLNTGDRFDSKLKIELDICKQLAESS
jgi:hypothetical protein